MISLSQMILTLQHLVSHLSPSLFTSDEADFTVRINGNDREGIVEVSYSGRWGSVCEDGFWLSPNAEVVCDQLGINSESTPSTFPGGE